MQKSANKWQVQFLASVSTVANEKAFAKSWKQNSCASLETAALHSFSRRKEETWCSWMAESLMYQFWTGSLVLFTSFPNIHTWANVPSKIAGLTAILSEEKFKHICLHVFMHLKNILALGLLLRKTVCRDTAILLPEIHACSSLGSGLLVEQVYLHCMREGQIYSLISSMIAHYGWLRSHQGFKMESLKHQTSFPCIFPVCVSHPRKVNMNRGQ